MNPNSQSLKNIKHMAGAQLSVAAKLGYVALLLVSAAMTSVIVSLWITEASLPLRTQIAFGVMSLIGLSWLALASWTLRARRPLYARDRVIAGRMAVVFTAVFVLGSVVAVIVSGSAAAYGALVTGLVMLGLAIGALAAARRRFAELAARRRQLEGELAAR